MIKPGDIVNCPFDEVGIFLYNETNKPWGNMAYVKITAATLNDINDVVGYNISKLSPIVYDDFEMID